MFNSIFSRPSKEQLYMLEFLVDDIVVFSENYPKAYSPLYVRLKFNDLPTFEIGQGQFALIKEKRKVSVASESITKLGHKLINFDTGQSCLFSTQPKDLLKIIKGKALKVGVYKEQIQVPCSETEEEPICEAVVTLSGCICDEEAIIHNSYSDSIPKSYMINNTYNLMDKEGNLFGTITFFLKLSCFGYNIATQFAIQGNSFLFKTAQSFNEFQCTKLFSNEKEKVEETFIPNEYEKSDLNLSPTTQHVIGLVSVCQDLAKKDGDPSCSVPSKVQCLNKSKIILNQNEYPPAKVSYIDHFCICPSKHMSDFSRCKNKYTGGICVGKKCIDLFQRHFVADSETRSFYDDNCSNEKKEVCDILERMRGGGCNVEKKPEVASKLKNNTDFILPADNKHFFITNSTDALIIRDYNAKNYESFNEQGCCFDEEVEEDLKGIKSSLLKKNFTCSKNPHSDIDCLIKAFRETQEFVDSIGKVPGMTGLGLMDPSESPYFGRNRFISGNTCLSKSYQSHITSRPFSYNNEITKKSLFDAKINTVSKTLGDEFSNLTNINSITKKDYSKLDTSEIFLQMEKKDEKHKDHNTLNDFALLLEQTETSPCGQTMCKSRRKQVSDDSNNNNNNNGIISKVSILKKEETRLKSFSSNTSSIKMNMRTKYRRKEAAQKRSFYQMSPYKLSRKLNNGNNSVQVNRHILRRVNAMRMKNPGIYYGHKNCIDLYMGVPAKMGWQWNTFDISGTLKPRLGWKPGAISKCVYKLLKAAKAKSEVVQENVSTTLDKGKKEKLIKSRSTFSLHQSQRTIKDEENEQTEFPPTLHIHRKDGVCYITMYPIKQDEANFQDVKPLQFKVTKNKDTVSICSSSTDLNMEIDLSPPVAILQSEKRPKMKDMNTQVKQQEILDIFKNVGMKKDKGKKLK